MKRNHAALVGEIALCDAPVGAVVDVLHVAEGQHGQGRRLEDLGLLAGTRVTVERTAPLGDPTVYEVRRARLAIRRTEAALVTVRLVPAAGAAGAEGRDGAL